MAQSKTPSASSASWTSMQAYVLATICLVVGIAVGYLLRGSAASNSKRSQARPWPRLLPLVACPRWAANRRRNNSSTWRTSRQSQS